MFSKGKHLNVLAIFLNQITNKKILFTLLAIAIVAILAPTISFAAEVLATQGETLPEKVENAINEIIGEADVSPAAPNEDMSNYLCFTPEGASATFSFDSHAGSPAKQINPVYYSDDAGSTWNELALKEPLEITGPVYIKSNNPFGFNTDQNDYYYFDIFEDNKIKASGSVRSLIDDGTGTMFSIQHIPFCFRSLFQGCSGLTSAPELPALKIADWSYSGMFAGCESLEYPPVLPATQLAEGCYWNMFAGCTALTKAPELPAIELTTECYEYMFEDCDSLVKAPYLPAKALAPSCYDSMFYDCDELNEVYVEFSSWDDDNSSTNDWLNGVPTSGVFKCPKELPIIRDASHIPTNWQIQYNITASVEGYNKPYDGQEHGITITPIEPLEINIEYSSDGIEWDTEPITKKDIGEYNVYYRLSAVGYLPLEGSAMIVITPNSDASANFVGAPYSKMYGDKDPDFQMHFQGFVDGLVPKLYEDYTIVRETGEDVTAGGESYKVTFNWLNPNYTIPSMETTLTITKTNKYKLVCDDVSKVSYEDDPTFTAHMEGLKFEDELLSTDYKIQKVPSNDNPSVITLIPSFSDDVSDRLKNNYDITDSDCFVSGTYKIYENPARPEFRFSVDSYDSYYDGQYHEFSIDVKNPSSGATVQYKKEGDTEWRVEPYTFKNVGEYEITYKITHEGFEDLEDSATLTIQKAPATIAVDSCIKVQGEADPEFSARITGLAEGESFVPGIDYVLERQQGEEPGKYTIECKILDNSVIDNYEISTLDSSLYITSNNGGGGSTNPEQVDGGASGAKTGDNNFEILAFLALSVIVAGGYLIARKTQASKSR